MQREKVAVQASALFSRAVEDRLPSSTPHRAASRRRAIEHHRGLVRDAARSDRERLAVACLRLLLAAYDDADEAAYAQAYEYAELHLGRRWAVDYIRAISAIVRIVRRERDAGFRYLRDACGILTADEDQFLSALQAAIDGNSVGVEAGSIVLAQSMGGRGIVDDVWRVAKLTMAAEWLCAGRPIQP